MSNYKITVTEINSQNSSISETSTQSAAFVSANTLKDRFRKTIRIVNMNPEDYKFKVVIKQGNKVVYSKIEK